ncbi:MAG: hypothetical protein EOO10_10690 [Chitinophagaceae bacterium]|nr:MAG: hypothetical protein EOO10_10690 [Chitinophagaceae bacterium]
MLSTEEMELGWVSAIVYEDILDWLQAAEKDKKDVKLARDGNNNWSVKEGGAKIKINYNPENYFVAGDAYLCQLPADTTQIKPLYQFLLEENFTLDGLVLSCLRQNIVLSCIMYDLDMTKENGIEMFRDLFQKADYYDQLLEKQYGCQELLEE